MALFSAFARLLLLIAPSEVSSQVFRGAGIDASGQVRANRVNRVSSGSWSQAVAKSRSKLGLSFWRALRKELEAKRTDLLSSDSSASSTAARRDLLWQAVRKVDDEFDRRTICKVAEGATYAKHVMSFVDHTSYSKADSASARECALMCATDSLDDRNHKNFASNKRSADLACKSFTYNKTDHECKLFNFAQQGHDSWQKDTCCTSGPPCNLDSMRKEIQSYFHAELERRVPFKNRLASTHKPVNKLLTDTTKHTQQLPLAYHETKQSTSASGKFEQKVARRQEKHDVPKVEQKFAAHPERAVPKVEQKVATQAEHAVPTFEQKVPKGEVKHTVPKVELKVVTPADHAVPTFEQKAAIRAFEQKVAKNMMPKIERAMPNSEKEVARRVAKPTVPKVEEKVSNQPERAVSKVELKTATQAAARTKQNPAISDHVSPAASTVSHLSLANSMSLLVWIHWRLVLVLFCVPILVAVIARWFPRISVPCMVKRLDD